MVENGADVSYLDTVAQLLTEAGLDVVPQAEVAAMGPFSFVKWVSLLALPHF